MEELLQQQNQLPTPDTIRVVIIDDHVHIRQLVAQYLQRYFEGVVTIVGEADRVKSSIELLKTTETDIIFLDIDLTDGLGFEAIESLSKEQRDRVVIIIITMERERVYMKQAIEYRALAFIDKPLVANEFNAAVTKAIEEIKKIRRIQTQLADVQPAENKQRIPAKQERVIEVRVMSQNQVKTHRFTVGEVVYAQAARSYCLIVTKDGTNYLPSLPLKHFQDTLIDDGCIRISRSTIVNPVHVKFRLAPDQETIIVPLPKVKEVAVEQQFRDSALMYLQKDH